MERSYGLQWLIVLPLEIIAAAVTISYWGSHVDKSVFVTLFLIIITTIRHLRLVRTFLVSFLSDTSSPVLHFTTSSGSSYNINYLHLLFFSVVFAATRSTPAIPHTFNSLPTNIK